jgi:hypothetical protein
VLVAAFAAGCAMPTAPSGVVLRPADGPVWLRTEEIDRFRCDRGLLVCSDGGGRVSQRLCSCVE